MDNEPKINPTLMSRRNFLKVAAGAGASALLLQVPGCAPSSETPETKWDRFKQNPEIQKKISVIQAAKEYARSLGLFLPDKDFFDPSIPPDETFRDANAYIGLCAALPGDVRMPDEQQEEKQGCFQIPTDQAEQYATQYFTPPLETYTYSASSTSAGRISYELFDLSASYLASTVLHEAIHTHLDRVRKTPLHPYIEEPAAEAAAHDLTKKFAEENLGLIDPNELDIVIQSLEGLFSVTGDITTLVEQAENDEQRKSAYIQYKTSIENLAGRLESKDPKLAAMMIGTDEQYNTARLQRHIPYALHFFDMQQVYKSSDSPEDFFGFLNSLPSDYREAEKMIREKLENTP